MLLNLRMLPDNMKKLSAKMDFLLREKTARLNPRTDGVRNA
jgi:hypothetical protein